MLSHDWNKSTLKALKLSDDSIIVCSRCKGDRCKVYSCSICKAIAIYTCGIGNSYLYISGADCESKSYTCNEIIMNRILL